MLEEFHDLVREGVLRVTAENEVVPVRPPAAQERDAASERPQAPPPPLTEAEAGYVRRRISQRVERNRKDTAVAAGNAIEDESLLSLRREAVQRIASRVLDRWSEQGAFASLREEVVELLAAEILRRWEAMR